MDTLLFLGHLYEGLCSLIQELSWAESRCCHSYLQFVLGFKFSSVTLFVRERARVVKGIFINVMLYPELSLGTATTVASLDAFVPTLEVDFCCL